ncbi:MAG: IclR family transcriptional regulator [Dehalococcoidia bacterium]
MDNIRALSRGIDILYCFGDSSDELGVTDISRLLKLNKTTASRMLATLAAKGLIVENPATRKYRLTYKLVTIANAQLRRLNVRERALPHMRALRDLTDETVLLYVPLGYERSCVEQVESTHEIRRAVRIGQAYPITSGATGRTLLAWRSEAEIEDALAGAPLKPITPFTLATKEPRFWPNWRRYGRTGMPSEWTKPRSG